MKQYLVILLFFSAVAFSCGDAGTSSTVLSLSDLPEHAEITDYEDIPGLSRVSVNFGNKIDEQGEYYQGNRNGSWTVYHSNGMPKTITSYVNGIKHGAHLELDNRGELTLMANYVNGYLDGEHTSYQRGKKAETRYYAMDQLEGQKIKYYTNGKVMEQSTYKAGKIHGTAKWFDQDGNVTIEYEYENGELIKN
ncbi:toxin-antitoxin system YwqK family antitoxin [Reichenbachiella sp. MSK19-1]|uniref:toxin-antitoxin system YwqK family antitoxin n=1 Tax=Reichenbachiella sp. MSK19-1 TaxID=1897631 RepID=UPI000EC2B68D|nr:toxin-antitoxin system YwqK family antitoxin [Reichenbachiella sp. MSK19-1]RJE74091.1 hypothetical protein BGP76_12915 [Reichenbachiella sp. MSK19-1]